MFRLIILSIFLCQFATTETLNYSRPVRTWEFLDAVGQQASLLGKEDGTLEAYVYPLKLFSGLQFSFEVEGKVIPGSAIARRASFQPGHQSITYTGDEFQITETLVVPVQEPGGIIQLAIEAHTPVTIRFNFQRDFQLMWPASFGSAYGQWKPDSKQFVFGADGQPYSAVLGSPDLSAENIDYASNYSEQNKTYFSLGTVSGKAVRTISFGGSMKSQAEATAVQNKLLQEATRYQTEAVDYYKRYLSQTVSVELPDDSLQEAFDWSRISLAQGMVNNPFLGTGLVAGYGPSKGGYRPGFAWFFGRDSFWSSFAFNSEGDWENSRKAIEFVAKFQRDDGKIPHEISQSADQVAWAKDYPYEFASADATLLFITAVRDYVQGSDDKQFAAAMWDRAQKAMAFSRSTFEANGFPRNFGVGHGWVEGGPLLPVNTEFYMAGCYVEAVRSLAQLARWSGHTNEVSKLEQEAEEKRKKMEELFWLESSGTYAFALGRNNKPVDQPGVLTLVPEWWSLLELPRVHKMMERLADEDHAADWGMRIISSKAALYNPAGYHFGSVWPLFTGWASLGEYHAHQSIPAFANLKANSWLALDGAGGNTTEVLSGETYSPLSTATPHQIWSAAMIISPLLRGLFGLNVDNAAKTASLSPHLPADWSQAALRHVKIGTGYVDFLIHRTRDSYMLTVQNHGAGTFRLNFSPSYSPYTTVTNATSNGKSVNFQVNKTLTDWHPSLEAAIAEGETKIIYLHEKWFGITLDDAPPKLAETSSNLKLIAQNWQNANKQVSLTFSGLAGHTYSVQVTGAENIDRANGAQIQSNRMQVSFPAGQGYVHSKVQLNLK